jgi:hypothetical protein
VPNVISQHRADGIVLKQGQIGFTTHELQRDRRRKGRGMRTSEGPMR